MSNNLNFATATDCRNDGVRNVVADAADRVLRDEFDENMYPKLTAAFSSPPESRDGSNATLPG